VAARSRSASRTAASASPPADLPHFFERFHKAPGSRGSGLGLAIARDLVRAHGGSIRAESEVGKGTVMVVTLLG